MSSKSTRFPDVLPSPRTLEECGRAIREIQNARAFTVPEVGTLPTEGKPNQLLALNDGTNPPTLNWWDGTAWKAVTVT